MKFRRNKKTLKIKQKRQQYSYVTTYEYEIKPQDKKKAFENKIQTCLGYKFKHIQKLSKNKVERKHRQIKVADYFRKQRAPLYAHKHTVQKPALDLFKSLKTQHVLFEKSCGSAGTPGPHREAAFACEKLGKSIGKIIKTLKKKEKKRKYK